VSLARRRVLVLFGAFLVTAGFYEVGKRLVTGAWTHYDVRIVAFPLASLVLLTILGLVFADELEPAARKPTLFWVRFGLLAVYVVMMPVLVFEVWRFHRWEDALQIGISALFCGLLVRQLRRDR
jgi:hypothetical protein